MFNSPLLDVAIGLAFVFLMVSLLVSIIGEMIAGLLGWRAAHLWNGIENLLQSDAARNQLYNHPLIKGLSPVTVPLAGTGKLLTLVDQLRSAFNSLFGLASVSGASHSPSYIPSRTFALALLDVIRDPHSVLAKARARCTSVLEDLKRNPTAFVATVGTTLDELIADDSLAAIRPRLEALKSRAFGPLDPTVVDALKRQVQQAIDGVAASDATPVTAWLAGAASAADYTRLRAALADAIAQIPVGTQAGADVRGRLGPILTQFVLGSPEDVAGELQRFLTSSSSVQHALDNVSATSTGLARSLAPLLDEAAGDIDRFRENVEVWFNNSMDRVGGWYKRHTTALQAGIGLLLAVVMNIDALLITRTLWRDPAMRQSLVAQAESFANASHPSLDRPSREFSSGGTTVTLSSVELVPSGTVSIAVHVPTADHQRTVRLEADSAYLRLSANPDQPADVSAWERSVTLDLPAAATDQRAYARLNSDVDHESLESVRVTVVDGAAAAAQPPAQDGAATPQPINATVVAMPAAGERFDALRTEIGALGLPIGWRMCDDATAGAAGASGASNLATPLIWCDRESWNYLGLLPMLLGWCITAAAVSMGAPFWFDTLKRFVSIRSAGKAPEEKPLKPKVVPQPQEPGQSPGEAAATN